MNVNHKITKLFLGISAGVLSCSIANAALPGERVQGGCLTYALAYCAQHPGCEMLIFVGPAHSTRVSNALQAHVIVCDHGAYTDNMHPRPTRMAGASALGWCYTVGGGSDWQEWHQFRAVEFDHQTAEDRHVIEALRRTVR